MTMTGCVATRARAAWKAEQARRAADAAARVAALVAEREPLIAPYLADTFGSVTWSPMGEPSALPALDGPPSARDVCWRGDLDDLAVTITIGADLAVRVRLVSGRYHDGRWGITSSSPAVTLMGLGVLLDDAERDGRHVGPWGTMLRDDNPRPAAPVTVGDVTLDDHPDEWHALETEGL